MTYQYWAHKRSGEVYAVRLEHGRVTGVCGPLHRSEAVTTNLLNMHYDDHPEDVAWLRKADNDFVLYEP